MIPKRNSKGHNTLFRSKQGQLNWWPKDLEIGVQTPAKEVKFRNKTPYKAPYKVPYF